MVHEYEENWNFEIHTTLVYTANSVKLDTKRSCGMNVSQTSLVFAIVALLLVRAW